MQSHPGDEIVSARIVDYLGICRRFPPEQLGIAFDIGHAIRTLGPEWRDAFLKVRERIQVVYCRDYQPGHGYTRLGDGDVAQSGFFNFLRESGYRAPISLHLE